MNMHWIDWAIVIGIMAFLVYMAVATRKLTKSVADFLAGSRCAGRYLLAISQQMADVGEVSVLVMCEIAYEAGFVNHYWNTIAMTPFFLILIMSGWVIYRYRQTRAMTMAQFFEMRYSRKFRIFAGLLTFMSGTINFGVFPGIGARFFVNFCGFPPEIPILGVMVPTFIPTMLILIGTSLILTFIGGQIAIMVTTFWQGIVTSIVILGMLLIAWSVFSWDTISESLLQMSVPGKSLVNPFDIGEQKSFNKFYYMALFFIVLYSWKAWQGSQGFNCAAITPHESKMAMVVNDLRSKLMTIGLYLLIPMTTIALMHHADYTAKAAAVTQSLNELYPGDHAEAVELRRQMMTPMSLGQFLPMGMIGGFVVAMLSFGISTYNTYLHSWGSIFVQDVLCPLRKKPFTNKQHIWCLRLSIAGVAGFIIIWSIIFPLKEHIIMFLQITGSIYLGGAGSVIIGGLYWKRGTTAGAWAGMIMGSFCAMASIILQTFWERIPFLQQYGKEFPVNGMLMSFYCTLAAICSYVVVSLLTCKGKPADLDRLLHRGKYAVREEEEELRAKANAKSTGWFWRMIGVNSHEFSKVDKGLFLYTFLYGASLTGSFFVLLFLQVKGYMNNERWMVWWGIYIAVHLVIAAIAFVWTGIGGFLDLKKLYARLRSSVRNELDDGRVEDTDKAVPTAQEIVKSGPDGGD